MTTPRAGVTDALDENWINVQKQFERIHNPSPNGNGSHQLADARSTCAISSRSGSAGR